MRIKTYVVIAAAGLVVTLASLASLGWFSKSDWSTFYPDLIVGIVGAGLIGAAIAIVQHEASASADRRAEQTAAYLQLLAAITDIREFGPESERIGILARTGTSMIVFAETVEKDYPSVPAWFEAERQLMLYNCDRVLELSSTLKNGASEESMLRAREPILKWTKDFSGNVRLWRNNKLTDIDAADQSARIEKLLQARGAWRLPNA